METPVVDRRASRSPVAREAAARWLESLRGRLGLEAIAIVSDVGAPIAAAGDPATIARLASVACLGEAARDHVAPALARAIWARTIELGPFALHVCALASSPARGVPARECEDAVRRIYGPLFHGA